MSLFGGDWTLYEPCAGTASISMAALGARRAITAYQGSKWRYRKAIIGEMSRMGFHGAPGQVFLEDIGGWGFVWSALSRGLIGEVICELERLCTPDPREQYERLKGSSTPEDPALRAAQFLYLQRISFRGVPVGVARGEWATQGFSRTYAYGKPATANFGATKPMLPGLIRTLETYRSIPWSSVTHGAPRNAGRGVVYIDPPYEGTTGYPDGDMPRCDVVDVARLYNAMGYAVIVSEGVPIQLGPNTRFVNLSDRPNYHGSGVEVLSILSPP